MTHPISFRPDEDDDQYIKLYQKENNLATYTRALRELLKLGIKIHKHYDELGIDDIFGGKESIPYHDKTHLHYTLKTHYLLKEMFQAMSKGQNNDLLELAEKNADSSLSKII